MKKNAIIITTLAALLLMLCSCEISFSNRPSSSEIQEILADNLAEDESIGFDRVYVNTPLGKLNISVYLLESITALDFAAQIEPIIDIVTKVALDLDAEIGELDVSLRKGDDSLLEWTTADLETGDYFDYVNRISMKDATIDEVEERIKSEAKKESEPSDEYFNAGTISLDEFYTIETGMTYQEVVDIIGSSGSLLSEGGTKGDSLYSSMYQWDGEGALGANGSVLFQGGKVVSKAQYGLK